MDKFGSPTSYQIFPSILRMRCVKGQQPSRGHQEITAAIPYEATARDLIPDFSFISKDQFQIFPPLILALPKKTPPNYSPGGTDHSSPITPPFHVLRAAPLLHLFVPLLSGRAGWGRPCPTPPPPRVASLLLLPMVWFSLGHVSLRTPWARSVLLSAPWALPW